MNLLICKNFAILPMSLGVTQKFHLFNPRTGNSMVIFDHAIFDAIHRLCLEEQRNKFIII